MLYSDMVVKQWGNNLSVLGLALVTYFFESKHLLWHHVHGTPQLIDLSLVCLLFITIYPLRAKVHNLHILGQGDIMMYFKIFKMTHNSLHYDEINHKKVPEIVFYYNILQVCLK